MPPRPSVQHIQHVEFEPRASDFLELLRDLGHIDAEALEQLTGDLVARPRAEKRLTLDEVRRAVAILLFDTESTMRGESREVLAAEWSRLFY